MVDQEKMARLVQRAGLRSKKVLNVSSEGTALNKYFYAKAKEAVKRGDPVIWSGPYQPLEIYFAMGIIPQHTISYSALIGAKQASERYLKLTEELGYYKDLCRYCSRNILGYIFDRNPDAAPWGGLAKPMAIIDPIGCDPLVVLFDIIAKELKVPLFHLDRIWPKDPSVMTQFPVDERGCPTADHPVRPQYLWDYFREEFKELVTFLEHVTGRRLVESELRRRVDISRQTLWYATQADMLRLNHPCPSGATDHFPNFIAWDFYRGSEEALEHMRKYYTEIKARVDAKMGVVPKERYRLLWMNAPAWTSPGFYNVFEEEYGAVFVWEYPHFPQWMGFRDPRHPMDELINFSMFFGGEAGLAAQSVGPMWLGFARIPDNVDGVVISVMDSCKALSSGILYYERELDKVGVPHITINMDPVDPREWDEKKIISSVASFIETLKPRC